MLELAFVILAAVVISYVIVPALARRIKVTPTIPKTPEPESSVIHLYSGPNDGEVHRIMAAEAELPAYYVSPYMPKDEDGNPNPDEANLQQMGGGMVFIRPSLAYYQQVTETDYIYVRDVTQPELDKLRLTGELPKFKVE